MDNKDIIVSCATSTSTMHSDEIKTRRVVFGCAGKTRYGVMVVATVFLSMLMSTCVAYNATFVAMNDITSSPLYNANMTEEEIETTDWESWELPLSDRRLRYGVIEKGMSFSGLYAGSLVGTQPINLLIGRFGAHKVMTIVGICATIGAAISPICVTASFGLFVFIRFLTGLAISNLFPVAGKVVTDWGSLQEKGIFVAVLSGHVELAAMFTMPVSGAVAVAAGWPMVFYLHAILCGIATLLWALYYRDEPSEHPFVTDSENSLISEGKKVQVKGVRVETPVVRILKSIVIWSVWIACIGNFFVGQFSITFAPMYLSYVLGFDSSSSGLITLIPLTLLLIIKFSTGLLSDKLNCISEVGKLRLFNTLALLGSAVFFLIVCFFPPNNTVLDVILIVIPVCLMGFSSGGFSKCAVMAAGPHSPFVMSVIQMVACGSLLIGSFTVPAITPTNSFNEWRNVFSLYAVILVVSNTIFICFAKADPCKWTYDLNTEDEQATVDEDLEKQVGVLNKIRRMTM